MDHLGHWQVLIREACHSVPAAAMHMTAASNGLAPEANHPVPKSFERSHIHRNTVVLEVAADHLAEPLSYSGNRMMEPFAQPELDSSEPKLESLSHRFAKNHKLTLEIAPTNVGESQEVEGLWLPQPTPFTICGRITAKLDETCFLRVQVAD